MLTGIAQPTSPARPTARTGFGAAGSLAIAIAIALILFAPPAASPAATAESGSGAWPWPLLGEVITPYKNGSDRYAAGQHRGLDIAAPAGTPVLAITSGRVSFAGRLPDGGNTVTVRSADGQWLVSNLHLAEREVRVGERVQPGTRLGTVGKTGRRSAEQAHLHLSVRRAGSRAYVDPMTLLGAQRLASARRPAAPKIEALERPVARSADVRAHTTGGNSPAPRHGVQGHRTAAVHSAGEDAHEGDAADGTSRVAPPPISIESRSARPALASSTPEPLERPLPDDVKEPTGSPLPVPKRLMLVAIAAICLVALVLRRRPSAPLPKATGGPEAAEPADVIPLTGTRRSA